MRFSALAPLRQFGKVFTARTRDEVKTVALLVSQTASTRKLDLPPLNENWRPNQHGVMAGWFYLSRRGAAGAETVAFIGITEGG